MGVQCRLRNRMRGWLCIRHRWLSIFLTVLSSYTQTGYLCFGLYMINLYSETTGSIQQISSCLRAWNLLSCSFLILMQSYSSLSPSNSIHPETPMLQCSQSDYLLYSLLILHIDKCFKYGKLVLLRLVIAWGQFALTTLDKFYIFKSISISPPSCKASICPSSLLYTSHDLCLRYFYRNSISPYPTVLAFQST